MTRPCEHPTCRRRAEPSGRTRPSAAGPCLLSLALAALAAGCAPARAPEDGAPVPRRAAPLPPIPRRDGALVLDVVYPREGQLIPVRDSTFIFGQTGTGRARLTINGVPVRVEPNGAFLAFLPVPPDGVFRLEAVADGQTARAERRVRLPEPVPPPVPGVARILAGSAFPRGTWVALPGERIDVGFRGTPGGRAWLRLPDGTRIPLAEEPAAAPEPSPFETADGTAAPARPAWSDYRGSFAARPLAPGAPSPAPRLAAFTIGRPGEGAAHFELVVGSDTARAPLALRLDVLDPERLPVGTAHDPLPTGGANDGAVVGRPAPGTTSHWFWPNTTRLLLDGERDDEFRVRLSDDLHVWVPAAEVALLPPGTPPPTSLAGTVRLDPAPEWIDVRIALARRLPFAVEEDERALTLNIYGASAATDWLLYGATDPLVERAEWSQPADRVYRLRIELARPVWGYQTFWTPGDDLVLRIRRPPAIDPGRPLRGLLIALDPGHGPPEGRWGPTRLTESEANLAIALRLRELLERAGARVLLTRTDTSAVGLYDRPRMAADAGAHLFVSIHNNALPDGVNPFENNGTSTFYFHPHSHALARALQEALVAELGLRDLGVGRASLAVVRWPTWFPAALTESMFFMIPEQEAALRDPAVQDRIARAHLRALERFVRAHAAAARPDARP